VHPPIWFRASEKVGCWKPLQNQRLEFRSPCPRPGSIGLERPGYPRARWRRSEPDEKKFSDAPVMKILEDCSHTFRDGFLSTNFLGRL